MPSKVFSKDEYFKMLDEALKFPAMETPQLPQLAIKIKKVAKRNLNVRPNVTESI